jgi:hypothetical protein
MPVLMLQIPDGPILDYASPMIHGPLRLARKSILTFVPDLDGMHIVESLEGKMRAVVAIVFSSSSMTLLGCKVSSCQPVFNMGWMNAMAVYAVFAIVVLTLIIALINSNWQQTILKIEAEKLLLVFKGPFKNRLHRWTWDQIRRALIVQELDPRTYRIFYELRIEFWSHPLVRLFTGQNLSELGSIVEQISIHLSGPPENAA